MEIDFTKRKCKIEGCTVAINGKCVEGLDLTVCTNHEPIGENEKGEGGDDKSWNDANLVSFYLGDALSLDETYGITSNSLTRLIMLAGRVDAGKTTLLASLYDLFQMQTSFADYTFAGSKTLIGFEKRCHESRLASKRKDPKTERTIFTPDDPKFLHLKLRNPAGENRDLLFTDISGEHFKQLSNSTDECKKFTMAKRADHFALFLDGDLLSSIEERQQTKINALAILRSLTESGALPEETKIQVIFSRWDLLESKNEKQAAKNFIEGIKTEIKFKYPDTKWNILFFEIASRPDFTSNLPFGHGIDKLLKIWAEESIYVKDKKLDFSFEVNSDGRQFSQYTA